MSSDGAHAQCKTVLLGSERTLRRWPLVVGLTVCLHLLPVVRSRAEDHADYRYGYYGEEHGRIQIHTHSALGEVAVTPAVSLKGEVVYDAISGATPTGAPPLPGSRRVPVVEIDDERYAGNFEVAVRYRRMTIRPQFAYSEESDYRSIGAALNASIDFNDRNTTLNLGIAQSWDTVMPTEGTFLTREEDKDTTDLLVGLTQLLSPKMFVTANFTIGTGSGYFTDPYKGVHFNDYPDSENIFPEQRPSHRTKEIVYLALTRYFDAVNGSAEVSYRFYNDSFGISAHTAGLTWFQKFGDKLVIAPTFRFYNQSEADFYAVSFPGDPSVSLRGIPSHYSSDYRLSSFHSFTYGVTATWKVHDSVSVDLGYKRYEMIGNGSSAPSDAYPSAHIVTAGFRIWF